MSLGFQIKRIRIDRGLTQAQLGKLVGKAESTVRTWELDRAQPSPETLAKVADALNVTFAMLMNGSNQSNTGYWADRFRNGLRHALAGVEFGDAEAANFDLESAIDIAEGVLSFTFEDACTIADGLGVSMDELLHWDERHSSQASNADE